MKSILLVLPLVLSQFAMADGLFFGSKTDKFSKNQNCSYNFSVPQVMPARGSSREIVSAAAALNAKWDAQLASAKADFQTSILNPDMCKDWDSSYIVSSTFKIGSNLNAQIAAIVATDSGYYGGAHGSYAMSATNFNTTTGQIYTDLADFIEDSTIDALKLKIEQGIKDKLGDAYDPNFGFNDWSAKTLVVSQMTNWYFSPQGLVVIFNPYEVASYAEGELEATVYWYQLQDINALKKTGPATLLEIPQE